MRSNDQSRDRAIGWQLLQEGPSEASGNLPSLARKDQREKQIVPVSGLTGRSEETLRQRFGYFELLHEATGDGLGDEQFVLRIQGGTVQIRELPGHVAALAK